MKNIKEHLDYDAVTGVFIWTLPTSNRVKVGDIAGKSGPRDYLTISIGCKRYMAHRLAWFYIYGYFPEQSIDHINGDVRDNRIVNLRAASQQDNVYNAKLRKDNTSGCKGVYLLVSGKYQVKLNVNAVTKYLGTFTDFELAEFVANEARRKYHGNFARI